MFVITGASGNTGSVAADTLLAHGEKVRVVGRDAKRLERFRQKGAEAFVADMSDSARLAQAFSGAKAVYAMIPPNNTAADVRSYQEQASDALATAIKKCGVTHVVALSSIGADKSDKVGPVVGLHNMEKKFEAIAGLSALFLRAGYFMENMLSQVGVIQSMGIIAGLLVANRSLFASTGSPFHFMYLPNLKEVPLWIILSAHAAIALGTLTGGWRMVRTMGSRITKLKPFTGF